MAGHSHWANIAHKKARVDAKRGKIFSKLAKNITAAARRGGGDPDMNLELKYAVEKAKAANMPNDNIDRAIKRGTGELDGGTLEEIVYEGYGPGGVAVMTEILTDNRNRTAGEIRKLFEVNGGKLGSSNCVAYLFEVRGLVRVPADGVDEEDIMMTALDAGAEDVRREGESWTVVTAPSDFETVRAALEGDFDVDSAELTRIPSTTVPVDDKDGRKVLALLEELEDHDDVSNVYANFDMSDEVLAEVAE